MNRFWHRRIYEVAFLLSIAIVILFVVPLLTNIAPTGLFNVSLWVAVGAGITAIASIVCYLVTPEKPGYLYALIIYLLFTATVGLLVIQTGGTSSPFIAVWMLVSFFAGVFAFWGLVPIVLASGTFIAVEYLSSHFSAGLVAVVVFTSIVPLIISMFVWRNQSDDTTSKDVKNLANQLSEVASKSEIVINAIGDGVIAVDVQGVIQLINPAAQEILGWGKQDALMLNYKTILKLSDLNNKELDPSQDPIQQVLNTNQEARSNAITIVTKTGKKITSSIVVSPVGDAGNGVIAVFRDVTKEKAEEREQAEFISTASHEMRTPVASIEGYLGLALNPNTAQIDEKARDFIMKAHEAAQHLGRLFQDLLDVSKSEDGRMTNMQRVVDMANFTGTIVQGLQAKAAEKGLQLVYTPTEASGQKQITPVYFVNQDNDHIREVLDNLIENAIKYTPTGQVLVDIQGSEDKVTVSVKDTGLGIPPEDVSHLFQKFYRVDNADRQSIGGTGLGLYLSRRLAEAMGGRLWVESVYKTGSTFFLELPRITSEEADRFKQQQTAQAQKAAADALVAPAPAAPEMPPVMGPLPPARPSVSGDIKPATTVPRGESLSREQIAEHVRQLQAMARQQQPVAQRPADATTPAPAAPTPVSTPAATPPVQAGQP
ncbi:MAG: ATP-binding protein [Candidatus Saccharimonadales bacterium]